MHSCVCACACACVCIYLFMRAGVGVCLCLCVCAFVHMYVEHLGTNAQKHSSFTPLWTQKHAYT